MFVPEVGPKNDLPSIVKITGLYDRRNDDISVGEVKCVGI
jgi:hypothetical protein